MGRAGMNSSSTSRGSEPPRYCSSFAASHAVDLQAANPLQAGHKVHGNGELLGRIVAEQEQVLHVAPGGRCGLLRRAAGRFLGCPQGTEYRDARRIENQGRLAVAEDRRSGKTGTIPHVAAQRLDDDLLRIVQAVNDQPEAQVSGLDDDDVLGSGFGGADCPSAARSAPWPPAAGRAPARSEGAPAGAAFRGAAGLPRFSCAGSCVAASLGFTRTSSHILDCGIA